MFKKILVAFDGSDSSQIALDYAIHLARQDKATLYVISAVEPLLGPVGDDLTPTFYPEYQEDLHRRYEKMQAEVISKLNNTSPDLKVFAEVKDGKPYRVILENATDNEVDLIVIGHRGLGGIISWMLGSVAKQIVDSCTVPVLIVKDRDYCS
jgi:nucleotide-binding universal stress UspA family protein